MSSSKQQQQACMQCTKRCLKIHGKKQTTSSTTELSFFKIMIGDFQEFLFLPPMLAQSFQNLSNKYTYLEDSEGRRRKVRISIIGGLFAFQQGWRDFVLDHNIQIGELVVFKYTNDSFSVQIFARSACERLHFGGTSNDNRHKREKNNIELPSNPIRFEKNRKSFEYSKDKQCAKDGDHVKKDIPIEPIPEPHRIEMTAAKSFTEGVEEGLAIFNSLELPIAPQMRYSGEPCNMNNGDAVKIEQHGKVSLIGLCSDDDMETDIPTKDKSVHPVDSPRVLQIKCLEECGTDGKADLVASDMLTSKYPHTKDQAISMAGHLKSVSSVSEQKGTDMPPINSRNSVTMEIQCYPEDTNTLLVGEDKLLQQHNDLERPQSEPEAGCDDYGMINQSEAGCDDYGTVNQSEANMAIDHYPHTERGPSTVDCSQGEQNLHASNLSDQQMIDTEPDDENFHTRSSSCTGVEHDTDKEEILFASNGVHHEETRCRMDEDLTGKFEASRDAPVSLCQEREGSACPSDDAVMPRNKSYVFEYSLEVKGNMMPPSVRVKETQLKEQLGGVPVSESGLVGNDTLSIPDPSEFPIDPERNSFVTGIMPQDSTCMNCAAHNEETLLPSNSVVDEFPISEDETYCNMDEDLKDTFEADEDAPIGTSHTERDDAITNCTEDVRGIVMPSPETIHDSHIKEQLGDASSSGFGLANATRVDVGSDTSATGIIPEDSPNVNCSADPKQIQFASNDVDNEFLINKFEACYNMDEDSTGKFEVDRGAPTGMYPVKNEDNACPSDEALVARNKSYVSKDSIEVLSGAAASNCAKDEEGNAKPSSDLVEDTQMEENFGTMTEDSCLQEKLSRDIKIESMDSGDSPLPNNGKFAFSVTVKDQTWIESPKILLTFQGKRKGDRRVVMLRDPEMRVWPILYHESTRFVGFIGGWKEFITANNLRKGDVCHFEHTEGQETTYQMLSSKA